MTIPVFFNNDNQNGAWKKYASKRERESFCTYERTQVLDIIPDASLVLDAEYVKVANEIYRKEGIKQPGVSLVGKGPLP